VPDPRTPSLAIILATDGYETIRPVIRHPRRQTIRDQLTQGLDATEPAGFVLTRPSTPTALPV